MADVADYAALLETLGNQGFTIHANRCVSVRNRNVHCGKCTEACPTGCIQADGRRISVSLDKCIGCGTCSTACPTQAITAKSPTDQQILSEMQEVLAHNAGTVVFACETVMSRAKALVDPDAVVKGACLGRLEEAALIACAAAGATKIVLVQGDCSACPYGAAGKTIERVVVSARELLRAWQSPCTLKLGQKFPRVCALEAALSYDYQRREFLLSMRDIAKNSGKETANHLIDRSLNASAEVPEFEHVSADGTLPHWISPRRTLLVNSLAALGEPADTTVDTRLWRHVRIDAQACTGCAMCAVFFPTAALAKQVEEDATPPKPLKLYRAPGNPHASKAAAASTPAKPAAKHHATSSASKGYATGEKVNLLHAPSLCVGCETCVQLCPPHAIALEPAVRAQDVPHGYVESVPLKDIFQEKGGPDAIRNSMSKLINSPYIWG